MFLMDSDLERLVAELAIMDLNRTNVSLPSFGMFKYSHYDRLDKT